MDVDDEHQVIHTTLWSDNISYDLRFGHDLHSWFPKTIVAISAPIQPLYCGTSDSICRVRPTIDMPRQCWSRRVMVSACRPRVAIAGDRRPTRRASSCSTCRPITFDASTGRCHRSRGGKSLIDLATVCGDRRFAGSADVRRPESTNRADPRAAIQLCQRISRATRHRRTLTVKLINDMPHGTVSRRSQLPEIDDACRNSLQGQDQVDSPNRLPESLGTRTAWNMR